MRCSKSPTKRKPTGGNGWDSPDTENHQTRRWLEGEVRSQLTEIDKKLAELSNQVDRCLNSFTGLNEMQKTCEKLLCRLPDKVPLSARSTGSMGKSSHRSSSKLRAQCDFPPTVLEADEQKEQLLKVEPFNGELTPLLNKAPWLEKESVPDPGMGVGTYSPPKSLTHLNKTKDVRRGWWVENVTNFLDDPESSYAARFYDQMMIPCIFLSVCVTLSQTIDPEPVDPGFANKVDTCIDALCAFEIMVRFLFAPRRCAFFSSPYNIIDTLTAVPLLVRASIGFNVPRDDDSVQGFFLLCCVPVMRC